MRWDLSTVIIMPPAGPRFSADTFLCTLCSTDLEKSLLSLWLTRIDSNEKKGLVEVNY